jgi:hypothetical protein
MGTSIHRATHLLVYLLPLNRNKRLLFQFTRFSNSVYDGRNTMLCSWGLFLVTLPRNNRNEPIIFTLPFHLIASDIYLSIYPSIHISIHLSIRLSIYLSIYLSIGASAHRKIATYKGQHKHRIHAHRHSYLKWDSNPRSQCTSVRRQFMPKIAAQVTSSEQNCRPTWIEIYNVDYVSIRNFCFGLDLWIKL